MKNIKICIGGVCAITQSLHSLVTMMTSRRGNQIYLNEKLSTREVGSIGAEGAVEKVLSGIANSLFDEVIFEEAIDVSHFFNIS